MGVSICLRLKANSWRVSEVARLAALAISCAGPAHHGIRADPVQQELAVAGDHHEQIVEVVRDAAGQASDGFHLLGLAKLLLQRSMLGDVFGEEFEKNGIPLLRGWCSRTGARLPDRRSLRTQSATNPLKRCEARK